jgi:aspartate 1-decarboxylase
MFKVVRAKLHGLHVTGCDLDYHGSITLDPLVCREAGIHPLEFVYIWNKNSGQRISTYVIYGEPGSCCCVLNGAAARTCQKGDSVIICATELLSSPQDLTTHKVRVLTFDAANNVSDRLQYEVSRNESGAFDFHTLTISDQEPCEL